jgi:hypothetical protein
MGEALREFAVVGEKEQAFALRIEPAHIEKTRKFRGQKIKDSVARMRITSSRNKTGGLVQNNVQPRKLSGDEFAIHFHVVALRRLRAEICAALSVDCDSTRRDQLIAPPARTKPGRGEEAIETHGVIDEANIRNEGRWKAARRNG